MAMDMWTIVERIVRCNLPIQSMKLVNRAGLTTISKKLNHEQQQPLTKSTRFRFCFPSGHTSSSCGRGFLNSGCQILYRDIRWRVILNISYLWLYPITFLYLPNKYLVIIKYHDNNIIKVFIYHQSISMGPI